MILHFVKAQTIIVCAFTFFNCLKILNFEMKFIIILLFFFACSNDKKLKNNTNIEEQTYIDLKNPMQMNQLKYSMEIDSSFSIFDSVIGLSYINKYYIDDKLSILFDEKLQTLIFKQHERNDWVQIGKLGTGPTEVRNISSFAFDRESMAIFLWSSASRVIQIFNLEGKMINRHAISINAAQIEILKPNILVFYADYKENLTRHNIYIYDINKNIVIQKLFYISSTEVIGWKNVTGFLSKCGNGIYFSPAFSDTIYKFQNDNFYPIYAMNISDPKLQSTRTNHSDIYESGFLLSDEASFQRNIFLNNNEYTVLSAQISRKQEWGIYNSSLKKFSWFNEGAASQIPMGFFPKPLYIEPNGLLWVQILPEDIINYKEQGNIDLEKYPKVIKEIVLRSTERSNPYLLRCKLSFK